MSSNVCSNRLVYDSYVKRIPAGTRDMTTATRCLMGSLRTDLMIYVIGIVINAVESQVSSSPVLVRESETARFRWQVPAVSGFTALFVISPSGAAVLLANILNNHQTFGNYTTRVTYTGNLTADPRIMAFDLLSVVRSDAGDYTCGDGGLSDILPQCGQKLVVLGQPTKPTLNGPSAPVFGTQVTLTCSSTSTTVPADHGQTLTYTWQRDNTDIPLTYPGSPYTFTVSSRDSHSYRCRARESQGLESEWSQGYNMEPQYGPYVVTLQPSTLSYTRREGQERVPSILCSATCRSACTSYKWFKDGTVHSDGATLTLPVADRSQTGSYKCQASNIHGTNDSSSVSVDVTYFPEVTLGPTCQQHTVYVGQPNAQLICQVTAANPPVTSYIWTHNGSPIPSATSREYSLSPVSRSSGGSYTCVGRNSVGTSSVSAVTVEVQYKPSVSVPQSTPVMESQTLNISCSVDANPAAAVRWTKKDGSNFTIQTGSTLTISNIQRSQAGTYVCTATNTLSPCGGTALPRSESREMTVDVQYHATISMFTANSRTGSVTVNESDEVTLKCQLNSAGNPRSVIRLLNGTEELTRADNSLTSEYRLESADCRQRGNYSCTAGNNIGAPVSQRVELLVKCSPRLDAKFHPQLKYASRLGGNVNVSVSVMAYPFPTFTWSRTTSTSQDLTGSSSPVSDISVTARLHLTNLQQQDFGEYSLTVGNGVGVSVAYILNIVSVGPPQTPTQFRDLDNATTSSVWLSWLPGFNGGHPQTFLIEYRQFATRTWTVYNSYDDTGTMIVVQVTGLTPGDIYPFRLHARNDYGDSNRYVFVETTTAGDPPNQQKLETPCSYTGVIAGSTIGTLILTLLIGGIVLMVLYRKFGNRLKGNASRKSTGNPETVELDNRGYSSLDQINGPAQYSNLELESEKQQYSQLKIYENTKADAAADTSTYEGITETPPVTYESISTSPYQNTGGHAEGPDNGNT